MAEHVNVENFCRAESNRMFASFVGMAGGVNRWFHIRRPTGIDQQTVIRMNRDTLYSVTIVDISQGATVTIPEGDGRYVSLMILDQDHYVSDVLHDPGPHHLDAADFQTPYIAVVGRTFVDPNDDADVAAANAIQDGFTVEAEASTPFASPEYDTASFDRVRQAILDLGEANDGPGNRAFGARGVVHPVAHIIGTAAGFGGLPSSEAVYVFGVSPGTNRSTMVVKDVPVDGFWSVSVYNHGGYFEKNDLDLYSVNGVTATPNADGTVTIHFGDWPDGTPNRIPTTDGWNYVARLYRPRSSVHDGSWTFPTPQPA